MSPIDGRVSVQIDGSQLSVGERLVCASRDLLAGDADRQLGVQRGRLPKAARQRRGQGRPGSQRGWRALSANGRCAGAQQDDRTTQGNRGGISGSDHDPKLRHLARFRNTNFTSGGNQVQPGRPDRRRSGSSRQIYGVRVPGRWAALRRRSSRSTVTGAARASLCGLRPAEQCETGRAVAFDERACRACLRSALFSVVPCLRR